MIDKHALTRRLERLVAGGSMLTGDSSLESVLQGVADLAREVLETRYAAVSLLAADRRSLAVFVTSGLTPDEIARIGPPPTGKGLLGTVIRNQQPLRVHSIADHPDSAGFPPNHPPMRSFLGVPVVGQLGVLGNLYLADRLDGQAFEEEDEHLLVLLASMAASAVENARHHEESARLLADVQALLKGRERFFAMVNHELRNAIAAVYGWAELLTRRKTRETVPKAAFEVLEAAESAVTLINDLLDLSRLDEDRLKPVPLSIDLVTVLETARAKLIPAARAKGVAIAVEAPPDGLPCVTDAHRIEQILVNLLSNAVRHSRDGGTVSLEGRLADQWVEVRVADDGPGLPADMMGRLFEVYASRVGIDGVGLGLPLSRRLAVLLGGDLTAANRPQPQPGAIFTLLIPALSESSQ